MKKFSPDRLTDVPDVVMDVILSYLPLSSVGCLPITSRGMEQVQLRNERYYWSRKLTDLLHIDSIPEQVLVGIDPKKAYRQSCGYSNIVKHASLDHRDAVAVLLALRLCTPQEEQTGLITAINSRSENVLHVYIEAGRVDTPQKWSRLFLEACSRGMLHIVELLLAREEISTQTKTQGLLQCLETHDHQQAADIIELFIRSESLQDFHNIALLKAIEKKNALAEHVLRRAQTV